jgi:hypothetical protein
MCEHEILQRYRHTIARNDLFYQCKDCKDLIAFPNIIEEKGSE